MKIKNYLREDLSRMMIMVIVMRLLLEVGAMTIFATMLHEGLLDMRLIVLACLSISVSRVAIREIEPAFGNPGRALFWVEKAAIVLLSTSVAVLVAGLYLHQRDSTAGVMASASTSGTTRVLLCPD